MTYHMLFHIRADNTAASNLDLNRLRQDPTSQRLHGSGEGGGKHDCLTVWAHVVNDSHHLFQGKDVTSRLVKFAYLVIFQLNVFSSYISLLHKVMALC